MRPTLRDRSLAARDLWARARVAARRDRWPTEELPLIPLDIPEAATPVLPVDCIVFSKDRAMQLDACLRSIERFAPYSGPVVVIYRATTPAFAEGYRALTVSERVRLVEQGDDFRSDVMAALDPAGDLTVFHTDDDAFFRRPPGMPVVPTGFAAFSLRLGRNTTHCYPLRRTQPVPATIAQGDVMAWDWTRARDDFAYPMSLDGHVFSTDLLRRMLSRAQFANPNQLEEELHLRRYLAPVGMLAFRESCLVSIPANIVSATHRNRSLGDSANAPETLNTRLLAGDRIDLDAMDFSAVEGSHQDIPYAFWSARA